MTLPLDFNYLNGTTKILNNVSPEADAIISADGWQSGIQLHPDYNDWKDENTAWSVTGKGWQANANNQTTSAQALKDLYPYNSNYRYWGYRGNDRYHSLFNERNIRFMSEMITKGLKGVHPEGKPIVVKNDIIKSVADSVFQSSFSNADQMTKMVINFIINFIKNEFETIQNNNKLSIWVTNYSVDSGMQKHSDIKLNESMRSHAGYVRY